MSDKVYNAMKQTSQIWLPALAALYFGLGQWWGFPKIEEVIGSITVVDTVLGTIVVGLARSYKKSGKAYGGDLNITEREDDVTIELDVSKDPEVLATQDQVMFKVNREVQAP